MHYAQYLVNAVLFLQLMSCSVFIKRVISHSGGLQNCSYHGYHVGGQQFRCLHYSLAIVRDILLTSLFMIWCHVSVVNTSARLWRTLPNEAQINL